MKKKRWGIIIGGIVAILVIVGIIVWHRTAENKDALLVVSIENHPELFTFVKSMSDSLSMTDYGTAKKGAVIEYRVNQIKEPYILQIPDYYEEEQVFAVQPIDGDEYVVEIRFAAGNRSGIVRDCPNLENIEYANNMSYTLFEDCASLHTVSWGKSGMNSTFRAGSNCPMITECLLPMVTCSYSMVGAYCNADGLTEVTIPERATSIHESFVDCDNLKKVVISNGQTTISGNSFTNCPLLQMYVPKDSAAEEYAKKNHIPYEYIK